MNPEEDYVNPFTRLGAYTGIDKLKREP